MLVLRRIVLVAAFLIALGGDSFGRSHRPSPSARESVQPPHAQTAQPNNDPTANQRGTEQSPFIIKVLPTPDSEQTRAAEARREDQKAANDEAIARFTGRLFWATVALSVIAIFQFGAFIWQGIQLQNAVKASRDEFLASHRPKIRLKHLWLAADIWQTDPIIVNLWCVNIGTADARLQEIGLRYDVVREGAMLPAAPQINAAFQAGGAIVRPGLNNQFGNLNTGRVLTAEDNADIQQGRSKLYCVGFISYLDGADRLRITGFCRVLKFPHNTTARADNSRFWPFDDPDYEYED